MSTKPTEDQVAQALASAFGVQVLSTAVRIEDMDWTQVQVFGVDKHPLVQVIGIDGAWTFTVEFANDGSGDIEAYAAGAITAPQIVEAIARANTTLNGFLVDGLDMFTLNPTYDQVDRDLARALKRKIEALRGRTGGVQA